MILDCNQKLKSFIVEKCDFEENLKKIQGPAFKPKKDLLDEVGYILSTLQKDYVVLFEAGQINKNNWKRHLDFMDYKSLYMVYEIARLYKNHVYKTKARAGLTIDNNTIEL